MQLSAFILCKEVRVKQILCFGDSNTFGLIPGTRKRYPWEIRWAGILEGKLQPLGYKIIEEGLCGRTTIFDDKFREKRRGTELLPVLLESHQPDEVILMLGTNDCKTIYSASAEVIGKGMEMLLRQIKDTDSKIKIRVVSPIWLGEGVWKTKFDTEFDRESVETSKRLKEIYQKIARIHRCDFIAASDYVKASNIDRVHLDEEGHQTLANVIYDKIAYEETLKPVYGDFNEVKKLVIEGGIVSGEEEIR